jgi:hypothetical protein
MRRFLLVMILIALALVSVCPARASAADLKVLRTNTAILVDKREIQFDAYAINGNNYFKLRDIAYILNGTESQFEVTWDADARSIMIETGKPYTAVGNEMAFSDVDRSSTIQPTASAILLNGKPVQFTAYSLGGNNYFRLRDLAEKLNFGVYWNEATRTVEIYSDQNYSQESVSPYSAYIQPKDTALKYLTSRLSEGCPVVSYETEKIELQNTAFSYDNALVSMAFTSNGMQDEAKQILDAFITGIENDRYKSDRVRNAYRWGDPYNPPGWWSGSWYEDAYQVGTNVGNSSYVALAMLQYYQRWGGKDYLDTAITIMNWVLENCRDSNPGFTAGYDGWPENGSVSPYTYKSIEHNIDAYAAFRQLCAITQEEKYKAACESALEFITSMYNEEQGLFYIGSLADGTTPSKSNTVLDAQAWALLALGEETESCPAVLNTLVSLKTAEGGYPFHKANYNGGFWPEGTAFTALTFRKMGMEKESVSALDVLVPIQLENGGFPAATVDALSTGEGWTYGTDTHIAPAAWFIMAVNGFNPYEF